MLPSLFGVHEDQDLNVRLVAFADSSEHSLELQAPLHPDEQSYSSPSFDEYCLVVNAAAVHYGGVTAWLLTRSRLDLSLTTEAAEVLGLDMHVEVALSEISDEQYKNLERLLPQILNY